MLTHATDGPWSIGSSLDLDDEWLIAGSREVTSATADAAVLWSLQSGVWQETALLENDQSGFGPFWGGGVAVQAGWAMAGAPLYLSLGAVQFYPLETPPSAFCTGKLSSDGCVPSIDSCGLPSMTQTVDFDVSATDVVGTKPGMLVYGYGADSNPFLGGTLCIQAPIRRTVIVFSGGDATPCSGTLTFDFDGWIKGQTDPFLVAGAGVVAQYWFRDPADSFGAGLSDALSFVVWP